MDEKTLVTLEYDKLLERLAGYTAFSASGELARKLRPTRNLEEAQLRLKRTSEARRLLSINADVSVGGTSDIRPLAGLAARAGVLSPTELLQVKTTLEVARQLARTFEKARNEYTALASIANAFTPPPGIIEAISRSISERAEVLDSASPRLGTIRRELRAAHDKLMARLERMINDPNTSPMLQEGIITQRNGRYVIPLRAEFKGRIRSIVHDQSSSGATLFVEPLSIVDLNNEWHEKQLAERDEERRILAEISAQIGEHKDNLVAMLDALAEYDLVLAGAKYAEELRCSEPELIPFRKPGPGHHPGSTLKLMKARHPLLDPERVVPIDLVLDEQTYSVVLTGPNTGGKTVTLKTAGLLALMAQSGLHIPAQSGSGLSCFSNLFADIGDEQSIEQSLSTFSGHITNIIHILSAATRTSLVLLDELGAGTDPQEGSALARAILLHLVQRGITNLIATHYPELKAVAHSTAGVTNASLEFNLRTLRPTYHLTIGLPGRSNALSIAERLGLPGEIIAGARSLVDPNELKADDLLDEIHRQQEHARRQRAVSDRVRNEAEDLRKQYRTRLEKVEEERRALLELSRQQAEEEIAQVRSELEGLRRELSRARQPLEAMKPIQQRVEKMADRVRQPVERQVNEPAELRPLKLGDRVRILSLKMDGIATALAEDEVEVQIGNLRIRARLNDIARSSAGGVAELGPALTHLTPARADASPLYPSPGMELDVRGQRAEDALETLERYIESAYLAGMPFVRIIHGKGTGKLRQAVREALRSNRYAENFEDGGDKEGGEGVTVVHIKNEG
jgi:DNA mismatch repair protein MutS2